MKMLSKKTVAALVLGAFLVAGATAPFIVQAAQGEHPRAAVEKRQIDPAKAAGRLAETYGVSPESILALHQKGASFRDINRAAFLAKASGKSLDEVLALKTGDNKWRDVARTLGITKEQVKAAHQSLVADRLNSKLGLDRAMVAELQQQGYRPHDIAAAGLLAADTGKSPASVLEMKKINNTWRDVASSLGVSDETFKQEMKKMRQAFPRPAHFRGAHR